MNSDFVQCRTVFWMLSQEQCPLLNGTTSKGPSKSLASKAEHPQWNVLYRKLPAVVLPTAEPVVFYTDRLSGRVQLDLPATVPQTPGGAADFG
jgi:hypothetical protein